MVALEAQAWDAQALRAWLGLLMVPRLGPVRARRLLAALGSPQAVFEASASVWSDVLGQRWLPEACQPSAELAQQAQRTAAWLALGEGRALITLADACYPWALLQATDPPLLLFAQGQLGLLERPALAMVGSRHATPQGCDNAQAFAQALSAAGLTVVSGLAEGIDAAAHEGALKTVEAADVVQRAGMGSTIAVVGTGLDVVYPARHEALAQRISTHGLMLSEFMLGTPPKPSNFPKRNRVVAGLSQGTLVVEAAVQSGSLITARLAAEMGRDVFAMPGSIHSPQSRGCHALIKQGAKLVETAQDVLDELSSMAGPVRRLNAHRVQPSLVFDAPAGGDTTDDPLLQAMGYEPVSQEALSARTGMGPAELGTRLLELELTGQVSRLPGLLFQRMAQA